MENIKYVKYTEQDIQEVLQLLDSLVIQGLGNIQIIANVGQILITKQVREDAAT